MDVVLVPGLWLTGDCWNEVVPVLEAAGHRAHPVTLPGTGSGDPGAVTLEQCIDAVLGAVAEGPVALVGHSAACALVWAAADRAVDRVAAVALVAGFPATAGEPCIGLPVEAGALRPLDAATSFDEAELRDTDVAALQARMVDSPGCLGTEPVRLTDERRDDLPVTVVSTEYDTAQLKEWMAAGEQAVAGFAALRNATYVDLTTGHWPMLTKPAELGAVLVEALAAAGRPVSEPQEFHSQDLTGTRFVRSRMPGAFFHELRMPGTTFHDVDLSGSTFRSVGLVDVRVVGSHLKGLSLDGEIEGPLLVNGIDVAPYVEAQLEERYPERAHLRPQDADGFRRAWDVIEQDVWAPTIERARTIVATDPDRLHASVGGEWSFTQTLRHLDFALDCWVTRVLLGVPMPWHDLDLPWDEAEPLEGMPWDKEARPDLETVLANREQHHAVMRSYLRDLTDEQLAGTSTPVEAPGHPEPYAYPVRHVLQTVLDEEWWHHRFAVRDLDALDALDALEAGI